jgi:hypothetical protein
MQCMDRRATRGVYILVWLPVLLLLADSPFFPHLTPSPLNTSSPHIASWRLSSTTCCRVGGVPRAESVAKLTGSHCWVGTVLRFYHRGERIPIGCKWMNCMHSPTTTLPRSWGGWHLTAACFCPPPPPLSLSLSLCATQPGGW